MKKSDHNSIYMHSHYPVMKHFFFLLLFVPSLLPAQDATDIVRKADALMRGKRTYAEVTMTIVKPTWTRAVSMKVWSIEPDLSLVYVTEPARDKGTVTLKRKSEVWNWLPSIQKTIKIPPSMMLTSWMGSDFTNDDLVRQSSIIEDYTHTFRGEEKVGDEDCYKIELKPKPDAGVVWGKVIFWISKNGLMELKEDFYDEDGNLIRTMVGSKPHDFDGHRIPAYWEMIPHNKPGNKTTFEYTILRFNADITSEFFSLQNMSRVR